MEIKIEQGSIESSAADTLIVNLFEGVTNPGGATGAVDHALGGAISDLIAGGDLKGKAGEVAVLYPRGAVGARRVLVVGLGKAEAFDVEGVRRASAAAIKRARDLNAQHVATIVHGAGIGGLDAAAAAQATVEGALLATYRFAAQKKQEAVNDIATLTIVERDAGRLEAIRQGAALGEARRIRARLRRAHDLGAAMTAAPIDRDAVVRTAIAARSGRSPSKCSFHPAPTPPGAASSNTCSARKRR